MKINNDDIKYVINKTVNLLETTRRQKAMQAIAGNSKHINTIAILTSENPMGNELSKEENEKRVAELVKYLKDGNYNYFPVKGKYGSDENSFMIYNISLNEVLHIGEDFEQESVIYIEKIADGKMKYQYWEQNGDGDFSLKKERKEIIDMSDADDFFTQISKKFKFQIPFFDGSDENKDEMNEQFNYINKLVDSKKLSENEEKKYLRNILSENKTGRCKYESRGMLYGCSKKLNKFEMRNLSGGVINELRKMYGTKKNYLYECYGITYNNSKMFKLNEASMSHLLKRAESSGFIIISACKGNVFMKDNGIIPDDISNPEYEKNLVNHINKKNTKELQELIRDNGFSYKQVFGGFKEDGENEVFEASFMVFNKKIGGDDVGMEALKEFAFDMCRKYDQDSVLVFEPGEKPAYYDRNGNKEMTFDNKVYNDFDQEYFTDLFKHKKNTGRNHRFSFTECYINPKPDGFQEGQYRWGMKEII